MPARKNHGESARLVGRRYDRRALHLLSSRRELRVFRECRFWSGKGAESPIRADRPRRGLCGVPPIWHVSCTAFAILVSFHQGQLSGVNSVARRTRVEHERRSKFVLTQMERALGRARFMWCNVFLALRSWRSQQKQVLQMTTSDGICRMMQLWPCGSGLTQSIDTVYEDRSGKIIILFHDTNRCAILQPKAVNRLLTPFLYY